MYVYTVYEYITVSLYPGSVGKYSTAVVLEPAEPSACAVIFRNPAQKKI